MNLPALPLSPWPRAAAAVAPWLLALCPSPGGARAEAEAAGPVPAAVLARALAQVGDAATALAPPAARVRVQPGVLDPRLKLAPCSRVESFLVPGAPAWGRTRVGLRCAEGAARWSVTLPVTVQVWAPAAVSPVALAGGARITAEQLQQAEVDWAASPQPPLADAAALEGRLLARALAAGQPLQPADLQARRWFAAGEPVRVVATGPGFSISTEGTAVGPGIEGQRVRVRIGENRVVEGRAVAHRVVEVGP